MFALVGCAVNQINHVFLTDVRYDPRPKDWPIKLIPKGDPVPTGAHVIASINARYHAVMADHPPDEEYLNKIKDEARSVGGDAIIEFDVWQAPVGTVGAGSYQISGKIVRFSE